MNTVLWISAHNLKELTNVEQRDPLTRIVMDKTRIGGKRRSCN